MGSIGLDGLIYKGHLCFQKATYANEGLFAGHHSGGAFQGSPVGFCSPFDRSWPNALLMRKSVSHHIIREACKEPYEEAHKELFKEAPETGKNTKEMNSASLHELPNTSC